MQMAMIDSGSSVTVMLLAGQECSTDPLLRAARLLPIKSSWNIPLRDQGEPDFLLPLNSRIISLA